MKVRISVTQKDINSYHEEIKNGTSNALRNCAVAKACKHNNKIRTIFEHVGMRFLHLKGLEAISLSDAVYNNINDICSVYKTVKPFSFTIEVPECLTK